MNRAWQAMAGEWAAIVEAQTQLSTNFTRRAMAVHFLRARFFGVEVPRAATLAYNPHRLLIGGDMGAGPVLQGLKEAITNERNIVERLRFVMQEQPRLDKLLIGLLPWLEYRVPTEFPAELARDLIDEFAAEPGARVLDPCHGWGGRMVGFLLSQKGGHYQGFDVDERTHQGVLALYNDLRGYAAPGKTAALLCQPFEDPSAKLAKFDFALTSPPYFDVERYGGELSSWRRYPKFETWVTGFYQPMLTKVASLLKPGAVFALQVGNQSYPLERTALEFAPTAGFEHIETRATGMVNNFVQTERADGEIVVLLRRVGAAAVSPARTAKAAAGVSDVAEKYGRVM